MWHFSSLLYQIFTLTENSASTTALENTIDTFKSVPNIYTDITWMTIKRKIGHIILDKLHYGFIIYYKYCFQQFQRRLLSQRLIWTKTAFLWDPFTKLNITKRDTPKKFHSINLQSEEKWRFGYILLIKKKLKKNILIYENKTNLLLISLITIDEL